MSDTKLEKIERLIKIKKINEAQFELSKLGSEYLESSEYLYLRSKIFYLNKLYYIAIDTLLIALEFNEEDKIIKPAIKHLFKKKIFIDGPFPADTIFLKKNLKKYDVIIGMYHDQVLTPIKTLFNFDAINITLGLPFIRVSPDHGPNYDMIGKNVSDPSSIFCAMKFFNKIS